MATWTAQRRAWAATDRGPRGPTAPPRRDISSLLLPIALAAVVFAFLVSNAIVRRSSSSISAHAEAIVDNTAPSIEHLARVRRHVLESEVALLELVHGTEDVDAAGAVEAALEAADRDAHGYLSLPSDPGEEPIRLDVHESWLEFQSAVRQVRELMDVGDASAARLAFVRKVVTAARTPGPCSGYARCSRRACVSWTTPPARSSTTPTMGASSPPRSATPATTRGASRTP